MEREVANHYRDNKNPKSTYVNSIYSEYISCNIGKMLGVIMCKSFLLSIEGYLFITRFKTQHRRVYYLKPIVGIEGYPFITRFKTVFQLPKQAYHLSIEGIPFITRFCFL